MEKTGYRDSKGEEFEIGDIVFNPCFRDYWIVGKYADDENMKQYEEDCPYYLAQYGDPDLYFMDLDEPSGFIIEVKKGTERYENAIKELTKIAEFYREKYEDEKMENTCKE